MSRLIDADEIKYEAHEKLGLGIDYSINESDVSYVAYKHQIDSIPTIDPVQHGYWITLTDCSNEGVYCSHCHKKVYKRDYSNTMKVRSKFCPNCGFKMDMDEIER